MATAVTGNQTRKPPSPGDWKVYALIAILAGVAALFVFSFSAQNFTGAATVLFMASGAAFFIGSLLGFLFGIPKSGKPPDEEHKAAPGQRFHDNANLEEVSDWLTKIIVGLGLVELTNILAFFETVGVSLSAALQMQDLGRVVGQGAVLYFLVAGFLCAYLWTRTEFYEALSNSRQIERKFDTVVQLAIDSEINNIDSAFLVATQTDYEKRDLGDLKKKHDRLVEIAKGFPLNCEIPINLAQYYAEVAPDPAKPADVRKGLDDALRVLKDYVDRKVREKERDDEYAEALFWRAGYGAKVAKLAADANPTDTAEMARVEDQVFADFRAAVAASPAIFARAFYDPDLADYVKNKPKFKSLNPTMATPVPAPQ